MDLLVDLLVGAFQHGDDQIRSQLVDKLGQGDVLRTKRDPSQVKDDDLERGTGSDQVHILRQNRHTDTGDMVE